MTYSESARGIKISEARAVQEMRKHSIPAEFHAEGLAESRVTAGVYNASKLLEWLGY